MTSYRSPRPSRPSASRAEPTRITLVLRKDARDGGSDDGVVVDHQHPAPGRGRGRALAHEPRHAGQRRLAPGGEQDAEDRPGPPARSPPR